MEYTAEDRCRIWLSGAEGIGPARFYRLMAVYGSAKAVWENLYDMDPGTRKAITEKAYAGLCAVRDEGYVDSILEKLEKLGIEAVSSESTRYPEQLTNVYDAPPVLFIRGIGPLNYDRRFAIVGSRRATYDGRRAAREIAQALSDNDISVVSGMAVGIDTEAHTGALSGKAHTVAVLGCGPDVVYPAENRKLYDRILAEGGLIISEHLPGTQPLKSHFPLRNRIISGLSEGVLLVEGAKGSGAMITVDYALEQGREVFAVPGGIYSPMSSEPNRLICEGAVPVISAANVLAHFGWREDGAARPMRAEIQLAGDEKRIMEELIYEPLSFDELIMRTMLPAEDLNTILTMLELRQLIRRMPGELFGTNV